MRGKRGRRQAREGGKEGGGSGVRSQGDLNTVLKNMNFMVKAPGSY